MKVNDLIAQNASSSRKTVNNDLYYSIIRSICEDDEYKAKILKSATETEVITEDLQLAGELKRLLATFLKKNTTMTEAEAFEAASKFKLTADQARTLSNIIHEADYILLNNCNKKLNLFNKPDLNVTLSVTDAPESTRLNPHDRTKAVVIAIHKRLVVSQKILPNQKKVINNTAKKAAEKKAK